ncbi:MAG TPA: hypothetical protein VFP63_02180 [Dehalococcoidia bacterium]|nr:hypothetical protein [Dehalococcoidia bacterium]
MKLLPPRALVLVTAGALAFTLAGCFWRNGDSVDSPRAQTMAGFITAATDRYATLGAPAFWDLIVEDLKAACTQEAFVQAVAAEPVPVAFKGIEEVDFDGQRARAKILFVTSEGDKTIEWRLFQLQNGTWRVERVPGMEDCLR